MCVMNFVYYGIGKDTLVKCDVNMSCIIFVLFRTHVLFICSYAWLIWHVLWLVLLQTFLRVFQWILVVGGYNMGFGLFKHTRFWLFSVKSFKSPILPAVRLYNWHCFTYETATSILFTSTLELSVFACLWHESHWSENQAFTLGIFCKTVLYICQSLGFSVKTVEPQVFTTTCAFGQSFLLAMKFLQCMFSGLPDWLAFNLWSCLSGEWLVVPLPPTSTLPSICGYVRGFTTGYTLCCTFVVLGLTILSANKLGFKVHWKVTSVKVNKKFQSFSVAGLWKTLLPGEILKKIWFLMISKYLLISPTNALVRNS